MEMTLYHGSARIIQQPVFDYGKSNNDYGKGFYCTESYDMAGEWACRENNDGFINQYILHPDGLNICNLNDGKYNILNWLALLTRYRGYWQRKSLAEDAKEFLQENYFPDISNADIIIGYRADDSYFSFAQDFIAGTISLQKLSHAMRLGKLGEQIVLKSKAAFDRIKYAQNFAASSSEYYSAKLRRDISARRDYADLKTEKASEQIYILDIMRGTISDEELQKY